MKALLVVQEEVRREAREAREPILVVEEALNPLEELLLRKQALHYKGGLLDQRQMGEALAEVEVGITEAERALIVIPVLLGEAGLGMSTPLW